MLLLFVISLYFVSKYKMEAEEAQIQTTLFESECYKILNQFEEFQDEQKAREIKHLEDVRYLTTAIDSMDKNFIYLEQKLRECRGY